jgi:hypothetical protein
MRIHCDVCGVEIEMERALAREVEDEILYFCSPECVEDAERRDTVRGPGRADDPTAPDPA